MSDPDPMLQWFEDPQLPTDLRAIGAPFKALAERMLGKLKAGPQRTTMLQRLLEAKDAAVRQRIEDREERR